MSTRDKCSTIKPLSFRVDGVTGYGRERSMSSEDLTSMRSMEDTIRVFRAFAEEAVRESISDANAVQPSVVAEGVRSKLVRLRDAMRASDFVAHHEFIGTSVLIVADGTRTDIFWIDFAKTHGVTGSLTHCGSCHLRIHQDGIIHGLENLIVAWTRVAQMLCQHEGQVRLRAVGQRTRLFGKDLKGQVGHTSAEVYSGGWALAASWSRGHPCPLRDLLWLLVLYILWLVVLWCAWTRDGTGATQYFTEKGQRPRCLPWGSPAR